MKCRYSIYGNRCKSESKNSDGVCEEHAKEKCWCGSQAVEGCCFCAQLLCGAPLCEKHKSLCPNHKHESPKQSADEYDIS